MSEPEQKKPARTATAHSKILDISMLEMLVCPLTHTSLTYDEKENELISRAARLAFPVRGGIPIMLASEARQLSEDEYSGI